MKIAVIGGAGVRTPLLVHALTRSGLAVDELALFDIDRDRLEIIAPLAQRLSSGVPVSRYDDIEDCLARASFVFTSIRVGGIAARARDEQTTLSYGIVGQETVGPGGFAMAMRTIGPMVEYARQVERYAPDAWIVNFTNPVGIITQAVRRTSSAKIVGICDTPTELFHEIAHALDLPASECAFDYFGLNHLGWVREVFHRGRPMLQRVWQSPETMRSIYHSPLFEPHFLLRLRLLPTEYLYYYYRPADAFANVTRVGSSRGTVIQELNARLFVDLTRPGADTVAVYEAYLTARNAGYMQIESGAPRTEIVSPWIGPTGYDKIALAVVEAIHANSGTVLPLNVANRGNLPELEDEDVIEVPCVVNGNGAQPLHAGALPPQVRDLVVQVKEYERLTVDAALTGDSHLAEKALARNPLVPDSALAGRLVHALLDA